MRSGPASTEYRVSASGCKAINFDKFFEFSHEHPSPLWPSIGTDNPFQKHLLVVIMGTVTGHWLWTVVSWTALVLLLLLLLMIHLVTLSHVDTVNINGSKYASNNDGCPFFNVIFYFSSGTCIFHQSKTQNIHTTRKNR